MTFRHFTVHLRYMCKCFAADEVLSPPWFYPKKARRVQCKLFGSAKHLSTSFMYSFFHAMHSSSVFWYWGRLLLMPIGCLHSGFSLYFLSSAFSFWEMKYGPAQTLIIMRTTRRPTMRIGDMFFYSIQRKKKFTTEVGRGVRVDRFKETKNKIMNDLLKCTTKFAKIFFTLTQFFNLDFRSQ